jgi:hypothetical protein
MGILPMSITGILPVSLPLWLLLLLCQRRNRREKEEAKPMGRMPMRLMAKMAMLQSVNPE